MVPLQFLVVFCSCLDSFFIYFPFCFDKANRYDANICPTTLQWEFRNDQRFSQFGWLALNNKCLCLSQCFIVSQVMKHLLSLKLWLQDWCLQEPVRSFNICAAPALPIRMVKILDWLMIVCINLPCSTDGLTRCYAFLPGRQTGCGCSAHTQLPMKFWSKGNREAIDSVISLKQLDCLPGFCWQTPIVFLFLFVLRFQSCQTDFDHIYWQHIYLFISNMFHRKPDVFWFFLHAIFFACWISK